MAEGVAQITPSTDGPRDRKAIRAAIVAAARAIAERDGVEAVSLAKVAVEAKLDRTSVFQQFTRKEDLLTAIVSDDVVTLSRTVRDADQPSPAGSAASAPRQGDLEPPAMEGPAGMPSMPRDVSAVPAQPAAAAASASGDRLRARREELMRMLDAEDAAAEDGGEAPTESKSAEEKAPDASLDRRLRDFEQAMAAMEDRYAQVETSSRAASAAAEEHIKSLEDTIRELRERADGAEARLKASSSEVRAALNDTALRIQTVEGVARAALAEGKTTVEAPTPQAVPSAAPVVDEPVVAVEVQAEPATAAGIDLRDVDNPAKAAMVQMRQAAKTARDPAASGEAPLKTNVEKTPRSNTTRYVVAGGVLLLALAVAAGIAFSKGVYDGRHEAMAQASSVTAARVAVASPRQIVPLHETALDLLTTRAQAGDAAAEYAIGTKYLHGTDTPKDPAAALHWLTLAAVHGQPVAQYLLGSLYQQGVGAPADAAKALQWYEAAALQGNRRAMHNLGIAFAQGLGTEKNLPEAVRWFSRAAAMGYVDSQFDLAVLYERGDGVPQSLLDAYKWYVIAGRQGDAESKQRVDALKTQLNPDDVAAAQRAADAFRPLPSSDGANIPPAG